MLPVDGMDVLEGVRVPSLTCVLVLCAQEDFSNVLWATLDSTGQVASAWFFVITVIGSFFLMNYTTAIVTHAYAKTGKRKEESLTVIDPFAEKRDGRAEVADDDDEEVKPGAWESGAQKESHDVDAQGKAKEAEEHPTTKKSQPGKGEPIKMGSKSKKLTLRHWIQLKGAIEVLLRSSETMHRSMHDAFSVTAFVVGLKKGCGRNGIPTSRTCCAALDEGAPTFAGGGSGDGIDSQAAAATSVPLDQYNSAAMQAVGSISEALRGDGLLRAI